jgi:hypothetical protein
LKSHDETGAYIRLAAHLMTVIALAQSLHRINNDVLAAYSKEDFIELMDMYAIQDTDAVKQMVSEGKVVGLHKGALVYLESIDVHDEIAKVRPNPDISSFSSFEHLFG